MVLVDSVVTLLRCVRPGARLVVYTDLVLEVCP